MKLERRFFSQSFRVVPPTIAQAVGEKREHKYNSDNFMEGGPFGNSGADKTPRKRKSNR